MTRGDVTVVVASLVIAALIWAGFYALPRGSDVLSAVVRVDGKEVARMQVDSPTLSRRDVEILYGAATLEFGQGKVRILPLPNHVCPNGICWKTGWISRAGQSIVCVPNHTTVTLEGGTGEVDSVIR